MTDRPGPDGPMLNAPARAPRGSALTCRNWLIEAAYRMIQNNLDPRSPKTPRGWSFMEGSARRRRTGNATGRFCPRCAVSRRRNAAGAVR